MAKLIMTPSEYTSFKDVLTAIGVASEGELVLFEHGVDQDPPMNFDGNYVIQIDEETNLLLLGLIRDNANMYYRAMTALRSIFKGIGAFIKEQPMLKEHLNQIVGSFTGSIPKNDTET